MLQKTQQTSKVVIIWPYTRKVCLMALKRKRRKRRILYNFFLVDIFVALYKMNKTFTETFKKKRIG